jgi:hypothetical protein
MRIQPFGQLSNQDNGIHKRLSQQDESQWHALNAARAFIVHISASQKKKRTPGFYGRTDRLVRRA